MSGQTIISSMINIYLISTVGNKVTLVCWVVGTRIGVHKMVIRAFLLVRFG